MNKILKNAKFSFSAPENVFSMFTLECLSSQTKILYDNKQKIINKFFSSKNLIPFNSSNFNQTLNIVNKNLKKKFNFGKIGLKKKFWNQKIKEFNEFFLNC